MFVGILRLTFHVPPRGPPKTNGRAWLKFRDRVRARFGVSIAEVAEQDKLQRAVFGVSVVSGDAAVCDSVLQQVAQVAATQEDAVLTDRSTEVIPLGDELYGDVDGR